MIPQPGQRIRLTELAPVSRQFLGSAATVVRVLGNSVILNVEGHGAAIVHRGWGTKRNPGDLKFEIVA